MLAAEAPHHDPDDHAEYVKDYFTDPCGVLEAEEIGCEPGEVGYGATSHPLHADVLCVGVVVSDAFVVAHHEVDDEDEPRGGEEERHGEGYLDDEGILYDDIEGDGEEEEEHSRQQPLGGDDARARGLQEEGGDEGRAEDIDEAHQSLYHGVRHPGCEEEDHIFHKAKGDVAGRNRHDHHHAVLMTVPVDVGGP